MPPRVRFTSSPQGQVAYTLTGSGPPLLLDVGWVTHLERMWRSPAYADLVGRLAESFRVVAFDRPGCGLSTRAPDPEALGDDAGTLAALARVVDEPVNVLAASMGVPAAIRLAVAAPDVVERLVLYGGTAHGAELATPEVRDGVLALVASSWGLGSRVLADLFFPSEPRETLDWLADLQRAAADVETGVGMLRSFYAVDVRDLLPRVRTPTLVLHREGDRAVPVRSSVGIAEAVPDAELVVLEGDAHPPYLGDAERLAALVAGFAAGPGAADPLSDREREVAVLVSRGLTNAEIGRALSISPRTVESHVANIREKLDVRSRAQIATWVVSQP